MKFARSRVDVRFVVHHFRQQSLERLVAPNYLISEVTERVFSSQRLYPINGSDLSKMTSEEENANQIGDWDDFAIQRSWNSAVAEYEVNSILHCNRWADRSLKKYHSIAKSGKPLEEVLTREEHEALLEAGKMAAYASPSFITEFPLVSHFQQTPRIVHRRWHR